MKTMVIYLTLLFWSGVTNSQEITVLDEARVGFSPGSSEMVRSGDNFIFTVKESYEGEFEKDPVGFMNKYLDMKDFHSEVAHMNFDPYEVIFKSSKGSLHADFDKNGDMLRFSHKLTNVLLPSDLRHNLYRDYKGWRMVKNVHIAAGRNGSMDKEFYRIKMENGKQTKRIKIQRNHQNKSEVASN